MPDVNVARTRLGAQVLQGEMRTALLDGDTTNYDMERGFTRHPIEDGNAGIVVRLGQPSIINHIRMLLWDRDTRFFQNTVFLGNFPVTLLHFFQVILLLH